MRVGVDTSVLVAALHANHPNYGPASAWLDSVLASHEVVVAHHSILETYAVLTRLPAKYRLSPAEAEMVLRRTLSGNATIAAFDSSLVWDALNSVIVAPAAEGASYDAFILYLLTSSGVEEVVTYNVRHLRRLAPGTRVVAPAEA